MNFKFIQLILVLYCFMCEYTAKDARKVALEKYEIIENKRKQDVNEFYNILISLIKTQAELGKFELEYKLKEDMV